MPRWDALTHPAVGLLFTQAPWTPSKPIPAHAHSVLLAEGGFPRTPPTALNQTLKVSPRQPCSASKFLQRSPFRFARSHLLCWGPCVCFSTKLGAA